MRTLKSREGKKIRNILHLHIQTNPEKNIVGPQHRSWPANCTSLMTRQVPPSNTWPITTSIIYRCRFFLFHFFLFFFTRVTSWCLSRIHHWDPVGFSLDDRSNRQPNVFYLPNKFYVETKRFNELLRSTHPSRPSPTRKKKKTPVRTCKYGGIR